MERNTELVIEIYRRKLENARRLSSEQRFLAGLKHSDEAVGVMRDGVRNQHPQANEEEVTRLLRERVRRIKQLDERR